MSDFDSQQVSYGLDADEFMKLPEGVKEKLVTLLARVSEASFRRGFHCGAVAQKVHPLKITQDLKGWRRDQPLTRSRHADSSQSMSSNERLFDQYPDLSEIGFVRQNEGAK